jgi:hypothetical protein
MITNPGKKVAKTDIQELWPETSARTLGQNTRKHGTMLKNNMLNIWRLFISGIENPPCVPELIYLV